MAALAAPDNHFDGVALVNGEFILTAGGAMAARALKDWFFDGRHVRRL